MAIVGMIIHDVWLALWMVFLMHYLKFLNKTFQYKFRVKILLQQRNTFFSSLKTVSCQCCQTVEDCGHALHSSRKGTCQSNRCRPPSIPQTSLLFILIGVLCSGEGLWVIRLTDFCARVVYNLLFIIAVKLLLQSIFK